MQLTDSDKRLLMLFQQKVEEMKQNIRQGEPYVWKLRLSLREFYDLESAINNSISSHAGSHDQLLTEDFAVVVVIYLAEWYKRFYNRADTIDESKILSLNTEELKRIFELAGIDSKTFVYNASKNPDKTSYRWLESLQVLGGLAVQAELKRDKHDNLLTQLCKLFHGEEIELDDLRDRNRAVAFQESIARQHSLYEYLKCILEKDEHGRRNLPFAPSDLQDDSTRIPELINKIEHADQLAKKYKFDFEWIIQYSACTHTMVRQLKVKLKPERIGGGRKQYIGYDRLRSEEWGMKHPENVGRIRFYLRFKNGARYVQKESMEEEPIFKYDNTGQETTGFLSVNKEDESIFQRVPVERFDKVEIIMRYDDTVRIVQQMDVADYMQVYEVAKSGGRRFTSRRNVQAPTVLLFSTAHRLTEDYQDIPLSFAHLRQGEDIGEDYGWCPIMDKVILRLNTGEELPFFNRNGLYQVVTKKYLKTIKYMDNVFVLYKYIDTDEDDEEMQEDRLTVLFGRQALSVLHFPSGMAKDGVPVNDYTTEWYSPKERRYVNWESGNEPAQGKVRLRVTVKGLVFTPKVYYVPFSPAVSEQQPIWRDFKTMRICTALEGVDDIQDDFTKEIDHKQPDTRQLEIGTISEKILVDVYRPILIRELSQKKSTDDESKVISFHDVNEDIEIPLINCQQFSVRDFSENGVKEYQVNQKGTLYYNFPTFNHPGIDGTSFLLDKKASELTPELPLDYLKIYTTKALDNAEELYAWNYKSEPVKVDSSYHMKEEGIVFQSLKDNESPRHYAMPRVNKGKGGWGGKKNVLVVDALYCFEKVAEHKAYFFLFNPLIKVIAAGSQIRDIWLPLLKKREYQLTQADIEHLCLFALQFHFDWMLLPRELWQIQIAEAAGSDGEIEEIRQAVTDFFCQTPKATDERERMSLRDFVKRFWTFDNYPKIDYIAEAALKLIMGKPDARMKAGDLKEFLKIYDECRFKFIEMSKAVVSTTR